MNARMRRLISDYEQIKKDFEGHKNIIVEALQGEPPEKYRITYYVNGIYLLPDGRIETLGKHIIEITLHAEYPRYKPLCKILTPIWHPNFRDNQICIGDIWGAGESLSDIIINIGDMIQYKSWNSFSPLSADAAKWAIENKHIFPVGNVNLWKGEVEGKKEEIEIDLFDGDEVEEKGAESVSTQTPIEEIENTAKLEESATGEKVLEIPNITPAFNSILGSTNISNMNDFEITANELAGIEFIPTAQKMQNVRNANMPRGKNINFKTIFMKGILYGLIGGIIGWLVNELLNIQTETILGWMGYSNGIRDLYNLGESGALRIIYNALRINTAIFSGIIGGFIGALMGLGEGIYYGSKEKAVKHAFMGLGISLGIGLVGGYFAQILYTSLLKDVETLGFYASFVRAIAWALMGLGVGISVGLIKPEKIRLINCSIGGLIGGFFGGFAFNYIYGIAAFSENDTGTIPRAIGIIFMGVLIGLGIGLLEQFAKSAWLKVIRGEFEGKEYLVFAGNTTIGNNGKNTIVLFKDKLVAPSHCEIILEGNKYILVDKGSPMGTIVNGMKINKHILRQGDAIAIGNTVLIFNTK